MVKDASSDEAGNCSDEAGLGSVVKIMHSEGGTREANGGESLCWVDREPGAPLVHREEEREG